MLTRMTAAGWSLAALLGVMVLSCTTRINVGVLALALAWLVGSGAAGMHAEAIAAGFPASLFLTLLGVTLLFALADANGTLAAVAERMMPPPRHRVLLLPIVFLSSGVLAAAGPGAAAGVAVVAPLAMALAARAGVSRFLMALAIANGLNAGNLSPISTVGIIAREAMAKAGLTGHEWRVFAANFLAHTLVFAVGLLVLRRDGTGVSANVPVEAQVHPQRLGRAQALTLAVVTLWIFGAVALRLPLGLAAFAAASLLIVLRVCDEAAAFRRLPLAIVVMVTGMTTLISVLEKTGGMELFTALLARISTPGTVNGAIALVTGIISTYSSTSGVVMPAFLPTASALVEKLGGGDPLAVALSINVGAALVDVSPLSTVGAVCVATVPEPEVARTLFTRMLLWGFSMAVVGALLCQLFAGALARL
jgi:Na+/H+ antiporter NhaD/arsenite permease-like protein